MNFYNYQEKNRARVLVTAIGSMAADCVISILKKSVDKVIGCDIYPYEWLIEAGCCDMFYQAPLARDEDNYIRFLIGICMENAITHLIPLTDIEIDVINKYRDMFRQRQITLCMPEAGVLEIARNKYRLFCNFRNDIHVPSIRTCMSDSDEVESFLFPCLAKVFNGRSSEGLRLLASKDELLHLGDRSNYIIQEFKSGSVYTVDYIRCGKTRQDFSIAREELLRTKNGAGLTVRIVKEPVLNQLASYIGNKLQINGCINMEFIKNGSAYYLIDLNPRFSAGIAFSVLAGYDMVTNHLNCFTGTGIEQPISVKEHIITKRYKEEII